MIYSKIEGEGKPFLVIHGFLGMSDNWKSFGTAFATLGFQMHLLDMRNHGRSFHSMDFSYEIMANDVKEYCEANQLQDIVLLGHSMGGKIAMVFASKYPDLVERLIIVDIAPKYYPPHHQDVMQALNAVHFTEGMSRNEVEEIISTYVKEPGVVQFLMKNVHRVSPTLLGFRFNLAAFNANEDQIGQPLPEHARFDKPTLFIKGELSKYIMQNDEMNIKKHFSKANVHTIAGAGHWVHADKPVELFENVKSFLLF